MRSAVRTLLTVALASAALSTAASAEIGLGADVVSRYVWRGADLGNAASVQPSISYTADAFHIGAWSSWAVDDGSANENDLYASVAVGPAIITITDYFLPTAAPGDFFNYSDDDGSHILEASASMDLSVASVLAAYNFLGDGEDSFWLEASFPLPSLTDGDTEVGVTVGAGNGAYTTDTDPQLVSVSLDVARDGYFGSYILNPDAEITFLVFGRSF